MRTRDANSGIGIPFMRNSVMIRRMMNPPGLRVYIIGYVLSLVISYLLSAVIRLLSGTSASAAWTPNSALLGVWVGFALWSLAAVVVMWFINRKRTRLLMGR
jgi:hypothetical protein